ncbi:hypothetical protein Y032_0032g2520 [Ancylostoma ceylanicum]|uniref:Uncharacterized protein n=1 Tax=Ancylostoma ceylanicum TaxID=53326 RepID=A0A016UQQ5_9BILA|nr:hypothetical protein Y032_0032g2520 [Ancylostoma ceylanicum]
MLCGRTCPDTGRARLTGGRLCAADAFDVALRRFYIGHVESTTHLPSEVNAQSQDIRRPTFYGRIFQKCTTTRGRNALKKIAPRCDGCERL